MPNRPDWTRITKPRGTHLSNPSTAADGSLGGPFGNSPSISATINPSALRFSQIPGTPGAALAQNARNVANKVSNWWNALPGNQPQFGTQKTTAGNVLLYNANKQPISGFQTSETFGGVTTTKTNPVAYDASGNKYKYDTSSGQYVRDNTVAFSQQNNGLNASVLGQAPKQYLNNLVGLDMGAQPKQLEMKTAMQIFNGQTNQQVIENMAKNGYAYVAGPRGGTFVLQSGQGGNSGSTTNGNVTKLDNGATIIEGQQLATGERQYAYVPKMKKGQNYNTVVKKDSQGNWVRYTVPVYDYSGSRGSGSSSTNTTTSTQSSNSNGNQFGVSSQLVNLRVNYG